MKKSIIYINIILVLSIFIFLFVNKNYPENAMEICLADICEPEKIIDLFENTYKCEYLCLYDIYNSDGKCTVYTGNLSMLLCKKNLTYSDYSIDKNTIVVGEKYLQSNNTYNKEENVLDTEYGRYYVNSIIKNSNEIYYSDTAILEKSQVKRQKLYVILNNNVKRGFCANKDFIINILISNDIKIAKSIANEDIKILINKLIVLLLLIQGLIFISCFYTRGRAKLSSFISEFKGSKYDIYFIDYIKKGSNIKKLISVIIYMIALLFISYISIWLLIKFINLRLPFDFNITSFTSIRDTILMLIDLIRYYVENGFTDVSAAIIKIMLAYLIVIIGIVNYMLCKKYANKHCNIE